MMTQVNKLITNAGALQTSLRSNGFTQAVVVTCPTETVPRVIIHQADGSVDPSMFIAAYTDPPRISALSDKLIGPFNLPQANADGVDKHIVTIQTLDPITGSPVSWNGVVMALPHHPMHLNTNTINIVNGVGTFEAGPETIPGEYDVFLQLQEDTLGWSRFTIHVAFF